MMEKYKTVYQHFRASSIVAKVTWCGSIHSLLHLTWPTYLVFQSRGLEQATGSRFALSHIFNMSSMWLRRIHEHKFGEEFETESRDDVNRMLSVRKPQLNRCLFCCGTAACWEAGGSCNGSVTSTERRGGKDGMSRAMVTGSIKYTHTRMHTRIHPSHLTTQ